MILTLDNLSLKTLSFNISMCLLPGSITILRGANGVGKTTLLRALAGIITPHSGRISINNNDISTITKPYVNYVGHKLAIKPELTVLDNLKRAAENHDSLERLLAAIHYFGLEEYLETKCYKLSAGNQKKVALSRLLACDAKIWLLDEPETNLDEDNRKLLANCIYAKAANGGIIMLATHGKENLFVKGQEIHLNDYLL